MSVWPLRSDGLLAAMHLSTFWASVSPRILRRAEYTTTSPCSTAILPDSAGLHRSFQVLIVMPAGSFCVLIPGVSLLSRAAMNAPAAPFTSAGGGPPPPTRYFLG